MEIKESLLFILRECGSKISEAAISTEGRRFAPAELTNIEENGLVAPDRDCGSLILRRSR
jgi:hypothetical protein